MVQDDVALGKLEKVRLRSGKMFGCSPKQHFCPFLGEIMEIGGWNCDFLKHDEQIQEGGTSFHHILRCEEDWPSSPHL